MASQARSEMARKFASFILDMDLASLTGLLLPIFHSYHLMCMWEGGTEKRGLKPKQNLTLKSQNVEVR